MYSYSAVTSVDGYTKSYDKGSSAQIHEITMRLQQLEAEVLALPKDSQAVLLARLLGHLGQSDEIELEVASIWTEEAELRDRAMDNSQATSIPALEVFQRIRASLQ